MLSILANTGDSVQTLCFDPEQPIKPLDEKYGDRFHGFGGAWWYVSLDSGQAYITNNMWNNGGSGKNDIRVKATAIGFDSRDKAKWELQVTLQNAGFAEPIRAMSQAELNGEALDNSIRVRESYKRDPLELTTRHKTKLKRRDN